MMISKLLLDTTKWVGAAVASAGHWWLAESRDLVPERVADRFSRRSELNLRISPGERSVRLELNAHLRGLAAATFDWANFSRSTIADFLAVNSGRRRHLALSLVLPAESFFERCFDVPREALSSVERIHFAELQRRTPFRVGDVFHDFGVEKTAASSRVRVWQTVIRKDIVDREVDRLFLKVRDLSTVAVDPTTGTTGRLSIRLRKGASANRGLRVAALVLLGTGLGLMALSWTGTYWGQSVELQRLGDEVARIQPLATVARSQLDSMNEQDDLLRRTIERRRSSAGLLQVLEELTRVLPDDSWVSEFRMSTGRSQEELLSISGFATSAAGLVAVIDASPLFFDATLTAPTTNDPNEHRERFSLMVQVRRQELQSRQQTR